MVYNYVRTTERGKWSQKSMRKAVDKVLDKKMGYKAAAEKYHVSVRTLRRYCEKTRNSSDGKLRIATNLGRFKASFNVPY